MRFRCSAATAALFVTTVCGQTSGEEAVTRVFHLTNAETPRAFEGIAAAVRTIADVRPTSVDGAQKSITVRGPADRIAAAEWLVREIDKPAVDAQSEQRELREYRLPGDEAVRVVHLGFARTPQELQEIATLLRTTAEIRRLYAMSANKLLTMRARLDALELARWVVDELAHSGSAPQNPAIRACRSARGEDETLQIFYLTQAESMQQIPEFSAMLRTIGGIRRLFIYNPRKAVVMRGTPDEMEAAAWLVSELDAPARRQLSTQRSGDPDTREYLPPRSGDVIHVCYLGGARTPQELQEVAALIRAKAEITQVYSFNARRALVYRGTADRIALAGSLIREKINSEDR